MVTTLKDALKTLLTDSINEIFSKIKHEDIKKYEFVTWQPVFKKNGIFDDQKKIPRLEVKKIIFDNEKQLEKKSYYKIAFLALKNKLLKEYRKKHLSTSSLEDVTQKELRDFFIFYFLETNFNKFNPQKFSNNFKKFETYLTKELDVDYCFATLLNFDGNFKEQKLDNGLHIKKITTYEFSIISGIRNRSEKIDVDPSLFKIKYVIGGTLSHSKVKEQNVIKLFEKTINALKIFQNGDIRLGGIYFRHSQFWLIKPIFVLRREPQIILTNPYVLNHGNTLKKFELFHNLFYNINLTKGKYTFLDRSISRFSNAFENSSLEDRVVDFVTSLESLYSSNEQELSYKFALRISALLGSNSKEKISLHNLMSQIYNMRSKIVHGDKVPEQIELDDGNKILKKEQVIAILENISRNSIMIFLKILEDYDVKEKLQKDIEKSIFDTKLQSKLYQIIETSKYVDLKFLKKIV